MLQITHSSVVKAKQTRHHNRDAAGSEELDSVDKRLYVIFESAGEKYLEGTDGKGNSPAPIDKILRINTDSFKNLKL